LALNGRPTGSCPTENILVGEGAALLGKVLPVKAILADPFALKNAVAPPRPHRVLIKISVIIRYLKGNQMRLGLKSI
jgi:hypothetical protein